MVAPSVGLILWEAPLSWDWELYNLNNGNLQADNINLGQMRALQDSTFNFTGGTIGNAGALVLYRTGVFNQTGGT